MLCQGFESRVSCLPIPANKTFERICAGRWKERKGETKKKECRENRRKEGGRKEGNKQRNERKIIDQIGEKEVRVEGETEKQERRNATEAKGQKEAETTEKGNERMANATERKRLEVVDENDACSKDRRIRGWLQSLETWEAQSRGYGSEDGTTHAWKERGRERKMVERGSRKKGREEDME